MPWAKVGDEWWSHPKVLGLSLAARGLWITALSWSCHQRRDLVPSGFVRMVEGEDDTVSELVAAGLWDAVPGGWRFHDWSQYQELSLSEKRADAGRKGGESKARKQTPSKVDLPEVANGLAGPSLPDPSLPIPTPPPDADLSTTEAVPPVELSTVLIMLVDRAEAAEPGKIRNRAAWRDRVLERVALMESTRIVEILSAHPDWTAEQIANEVERRPAPVSTAAVPAPFVAPPPEVSRAEFEGAAAAAPERIAGLKASLSPLRAVPDA